MPAAPPPMMTTFFLVSLATGLLAILSRKEICRRIVRNEVSVDEEAAPLNKETAQGRARDDDL